MHEVGSLPCNITCQSLHFNFIRILWSYSYIIFLQWIYRQITAGQPMEDWVTGYSALAPEALITFDHWTSSRSMSIAYSSGVLGSGSAPSIASRLRTSLDSSAARSAVSRRSMI